jgi:hypothetical protein
MRPCQLLIVGALLLAAAPARSAVFEIQLPELVGTYPFGPDSTQFVRAATFHLPGTPAVVRGASLHLRGTAQVGTYLCDLEVPTYQPWVTLVQANIQEPVQTYAYWDLRTFQSSTPGSFEWTVPLTWDAYPNAPSTWQSMLDGVDTISLWGGPAYSAIPECYPQTPQPSMTIEGASILIDADIPVPARRASWGALKAIYR